MRRLRPLPLLVLLGATACAPALGDVTPALTATDRGTIWFATPGSLVRSPDGARFVSGPPIVLSGDLQFPAGGGRVAAVVLAHGCGGPGNAERGWAPVLRDWGYATFLIDSFRGRGLTEVCTSALTLTGTQRIPDAYGALRILATHPRIDPARVALMGFSHGGILTLGAATAWARETYAPAGQPAFRAFLPFYPYCNTVYPERERLSGPLRIHTGELDDWTPAAPCARLVETLRAAGQDAAITIYPGAHHSFDNIGRSYQRLPAVDNGADCTLRLPSVLGPFPGSEIAACLRKGASLGWSPEATEQARASVRAQLAELLRAR
jgi:dienelactone hydrolase